MFVDISGFTSLTERLSRKGKVGAEEMNDVLDATFTELLSVAYDYGAGVVKWGGDAILLLFRGDGHAWRACGAAWAMQRAMRSIGRLRTSAGRVTLRMSVGVHTGSFDFFFVGRLHRELVIVGPAANATVATESAAKAGEIVVSAATAAELDPALLGAARGRGAVLGRPPTVVVDRTPAVGDVGDVDLTRCVPIAIAGHLIDGGGEAEHRPLTIAFLHFGGTDALLAAAGADAVADALETCLDTVEGVALEHKIAFFDTDIAAGGGKIMLVSGAPTSSGNDEERMLRAVRAIADSELALPLEIGVSRGRLFAADFGPPYRRTYSFKGDAANLAARLMANAAAGQILVSDEVLTRSRTEFEIEPLAPFAVKGKTEPVQAYVLGAAAGVRARRGETPLVGREQELRRLLGAVESARAYEGRIVEIVGDPGIGKSRLIQALGDAVVPDTFIAVQCDEYEATTPYHPVHFLLRSLLAPTGAELTRARLRSRVERAAPHLLPWLPLLAVPVGLDLPDTPETEPLEGEYRKRRLEEVVTELLGMLLLRPAVVVFEDVHWLDEASADLLAHVAVTLEARPWLVVATRRDRPTTFSVPEAANPEQIWLEPLTAEASAELIERTTAELPLAPQRAEALAARAGGNPLFLTELLAAAQRADVESLPDSVEALMIREIDRLTPSARRVLRSAAVIGATFDLDLLRTCLGEPWDDDTWASLDDFVVPQAGEAFRFRHMLARDTAYEGLPYRRRRELHARVGEEIELRAGADAGEEAGLLSLHFFHAHRFEKAWEYSRRAAERARGIWANVDAAVFYERAFSAGRHLDEVTKPDLAALAEALGDVEARAGRFRRAENAFRQARQLVRGDAIADARIVLKQAAVLTGPGRARYSHALSWLRRAERLLEPLDSTAAGRLRAELYGWRASIRSSQGRFRDSIASCLLAIEEAERTGERRALAHAYYLLDWAYMALGLREQATYSRRALAIYEELGDLPRQADIYNNLGAWAYLQGHWEDALELYERGRELRERIGDPVHAAHGTFNMSEIFTDRGLLDEAEKRARDALRVLRAAGSNASAAVATRQLGRVAARSGRHEEALALFEQARELHLEAGAHSDLNETEGAVCESLVLQGRGHEALVRVAPALAHAEKSGGFELPQLKRIEAYALLQVGDHEAAGSAFEDGLAAARSRGSDFEAALCLSGLERVRRLQEKPADELETERDEIFERLGVVAALAVPGASTLPA